MSTISGRGMTAQRASCRAWSGSVGWALIDDSSHIMLDHQGSNFAFTLLTLLCLPLCFFCIVKIYYILYWMHFKTIIDHSRNKSSPMASKIANKCIESVMKRRRCVQFPCAGTCHGICRRQDDVLTRVGVSSFRAQAYTSRILVDRRDSNFCYISDCS